MLKLSALAFAGLLAGSVSAFAITLPPVPPTSDPAITKVIQGCGPGGFRGPGGACRPRFSCPRGWHPGPGGFHCFPNRRY